MPAGTGFKPPATPGCAALHPGLYSFGDRAPGGAQRNPGWRRRRSATWGVWSAVRLPATLFGMRTEATSLDAIRHRLLEGVLLRLARLPDAGGLVLRGGMLLRHWFRPLPRPALDLDLVAPSPLTVEEATRRYLPLFADVTVADGVVFDVDPLDVEGIWQHTDNPGVRVHACGAVGEDVIDFQVDITGGPLPRPAPVFGELPMACGQSARVWTCRPESIVAQKVQALWHLGMLGWRPKDLNDLRLLTRMPMDAGDLRGAIAAYLADMGGTGDDARAVFGPGSWWGMKLSSARWLDFAKAARGQDVPRELAPVVAEVAGRLNPILEGVS